MSTSADDEVDVDYLEPLPERSRRHAARPARVSTPGTVLAQPARSVILAGIVCFGVWTLLAAPTLLHNAEASRLSARRSMAITLLRPLARTSAWMGLDRIGLAIDLGLGRTRTKAAVSRPTVEPLTVGTTAPVTETPPVRRTYPLPTATPARPLRFLVIGDSIAQTLGYSLARRLASSGLDQVTVDTRSATGLSRPDYFDWPAQLAGDLAHDAPDVVVVMLGGNDAQPFVVDGRAAAFASPLWQAVYRARVDQILTQATVTGAHVVWVGLPVMRSPEMSANAELLDGLYRAAVSNSPAGAFVDTRSLLADAQGHYQAYLPGTGGRLELVRQPDGIHLTVAGADRLTAAILEVLTTAWTS